LRLGLASLARAAGQGSLGQLQQALPTESSDLPFCGNLLWRGDLEFCRALSWQWRFFDPSYRDGPRSYPSNAICAAHFALCSLGLSRGVVRPRDNRRCKDTPERKRRVGTTAASILPRLCLGTTSGPVASSDFSHLVALSEASDIAERTIGRLRAKLPRGVFAAR